MTKYNSYSEKYNNIFWLRPAFQKNSNGTRSWKKRATTTTAAVLLSSFSLFAAIFLLSGYLDLVSLPMNLTNSFLIMHC